MSDLMQTYSSPYDFTKSQITLPKDARWASRIPKGNNFSVPMIDPGADKRNIGIIKSQMKSLGLRPKTNKDGYIEIVPRGSWRDELQLENKIKEIKSVATSSAPQMPIVAIPPVEPKVDTLTELKAISKLDPRVPSLLYSQALKDFAEKKLTTDEFRNIQARVTEANATFNPTKFAFRGRNEAPTLIADSGFTIKPKMVYTGSYNI